MAADIRYVDPHELRLPGSRAVGPDPLKLQRQIATYGATTAAMPPIWVYEGSDGCLLIYNGVTRATRIAKLSPGALVPVEVIGQRNRPFASLPKIEELLP